ncbi:TetR family transcriptional regulator [Lichenicola cladoniae]|uniref:TetR family transcriptional regulator n=1 Tax=Lichenicola cladoniae TaxID=1484109 RepID=A0A6M8HSW0_9PROT|nr:TetR family transcriptional regulator [Lichenicola cladoniae]NPD65500.1 TetR family transcriptional regulator [Acetobacteraceae bacterium]QKE91440.1 TetR family transcriptional regulator [Lichenicola cladoniae]
MDEQFDSALIQAAMARAELVGWRRVNVAEAARDANLPLDEARVRFPFRSTILLRLCLLADRAALIDDGSTGTVRERLFDLLMRRIDVLQQYRGGVQSVLRAIPFDPALALLLGAATADSMSWMAQAAGLDISRLSGGLRNRGLIGVWLQTVRAWDKDDSADLSGTMVALDKALDRAEWLGRMLDRPLFGQGGAEVDPTPLDQSVMLAGGQVGRQANGGLDDDELLDTGPVGPLA